MHVLMPCGLYVSVLVTALNAAKKTAELMEMLLDLEEPCIILGVHIVDGSICAAAAVPAVAGGAGCRYHFCVNLSCLCLCRVTLYFQSVCMCMRNTADAFSDHLAPCASAALDSIFDFSAIYIVCFFICCLFTT